MGVHLSCKKSIIEIMHPISYALSGTGHPAICMRRFKFGSGDAHIYMYDHCLSDTLVPRTLQIMIISAHRAC